MNRRIKVNLRIPASLIHYQFETIHPFLPMTDFASISQRIHLKAGRDPDINMI